MVLQEAFWQHLRAAAASPADADAALASHLLKLVTAPSIDSRICLSAALGHIGCQVCIASAGGTVANVPSVMRAGCLHMRWQSSPTLIVDMRPAGSPDGCAAHTQVSEDALAGLSPAKLERLVSTAVCDSSPTSAPGSGCFSGWRALLAAYQRLWRSRHAPRGLLPGRKGNRPVLVRGGGRCGVFRETAKAEAIVHGGSDAGTVPGGPDAAALLRAAGIAPWSPVYDGEVELSMRHMRPRCSSSASCNAGVLC